MRVKITNKLNGSFEVVEATSYTIDSVTMEAGRGIMVSYFNPEEYEIIETEEEVQNFLENNENLVDNAQYTK